MWATLRRLSPATKRSTLITGLQTATAWLTQPGKISVTWLRPSTQLTPSQISTAFRGLSRECGHTKPRNPVLFSFPSISIADLQQAVFGGVPYSAGGPDSIQNEAVRKLFPFLAPTLLTVMSAIFRLGYFPAPWKSALILPILKPNKPAASACSFRPISLISVLAKTAERIIHTRFETWMEEKSLWPPNQYAFRRRRSTTHALWTACHAAHSAIDSSSQLLLATLDLSKAYDRVAIPLLWQILESSNLPPYLLATLTSYIQNRDCTILLDQPSQYHRLPRGLPQGSVLSPALFVTYLISLVDFLPKPNRSPVRFLLFADDICLYQIVDRHASTANLFQQALNRLDEWSREYCMKLNYEKTQIISISRLRASSTPHLTFAAHSLQFQPVITYLGVQLDSTLSVRPHLLSVISAAKNRLFTFRRLSHRIWGSAPWIVRQLYLACCIPIVIYAAPCWAHCAQQPTFQAALHRLNMLASLLITGCPRNTSSEAAVALACLPDLESSPPHLVNLTSPMPSYRHPATALGFTVASSPCPS